MYDPVRICEILNEEGVRYIVVGASKGERLVAQID